MISFDAFSMDSGGPIYLQLIRYIKQGIVAGTICNLDDMPSRRVLSSLLGVNPNTIQKAYRALEDDGLIASRGGAGSCVTVDDNAIRHVRTELLESDALTLIHAMKQSGLTLDETRGLIQTLWEKG